MKIICLLILITCLMCVPAFAEYSITRFTTDDGLLSNYVSEKTMCVDIYNKVWFTSASGVSSYDNGMFIHYTEDDFPGASQIASVAPDYAGGVWLGSARGVYHYDGEDFTFYQLVDDDFLQPFVIYSVAVDYNDIKWFGTIYGVYAFDHGEIIAVYNDANSPLISNEVFSIEVDHLNRKWFGTHVGDKTSGISVFDDKNWITYEKGVDLPGYEYKGIAEDNLGRVWVATTDGVVRFDGSEIYTFENNESDYYSDIAVDGNNAAWAVYHSLDKFEDNTWTRVLAWEDIGVIAPAVTVDHNNRVWVGTSGKGIILIEETPSAVSDAPTSFHVNAPYPNPFNASVTIEYVIPNGGHVRCAVYDLLGRKVATPQEGTLSAGTHRAVWDGRDKTGRNSASGTYFYRIEAAGMAESGKVMLLR